MIMMPGLCMIAVTYLSSDLFLIRFVWLIHLRILSGQTSEEFLLNLINIRSGYGKLW